MPVVPPLETNQYYFYQELASYLRTAEEAAPHLLRLFSVGNSYEGRPIYLAEITNRAKGEGLEKPAIWIDGNLHGSELLSSSACLELVRQLVSDYGRDAVITDLLDTCTFYIVPRLSPDGAEHCLTSGELMHSGSRPQSRLPLNQNLRPADVNADGRILQMRIADEAGEWKTSRRDSRLLVRRQPDDRSGPFYRLYPEGFVEGALTAPIRPIQRQSLDFDRNFPCRWQPELELEGAGPYPLSEPETRAVADFFRTRNNIGVVVSCASWGAGITHPEASGSDLKVFQELGRRLQEITGYPVAPVSSPAGSFLQWAYEHRGVVAFRPQLWCLGRSVGLEVADSVSFGAERSEPESISVLRWLDREAPGYGFVPWTPVEHPQFGMVEVGGWDPLYSWINPPPGQQIQDAAEKFVRIVITLACGLPRLKIRRIQEEVLGWSEYVGAEGQADFLPLRRLTLQVENSGFLPSWLSEQSRRLKADTPIEASLHLDNQTHLLLGDSHKATEPLRGCLDIFPESPWTTLEWLVRGTGLVQAQLRQDKLGSLVASWSYDSNVNYNAQSTQAHHQAPAPPVMAPSPAMAPPPPVLPPPPPPQQLRPPVPRPPVPQAPPARPPIPQAPAAVARRSSIESRVPTPLAPPPSDYGPPAQPAAQARPEMQPPPPTPRPNVGFGVADSQPRPTGPGRSLPGRQEFPPGFGNLPTHQPRAGSPAPPPQPPPAPPSGGPSSGRVSLTALPQRDGAPMPPPPMNTPLGAPTGGSAEPPLESTPNRGRVLGSLPVKPGFGAPPAPPPVAPPPGSGNFTSRAQELVQAGQQARREAQERQGSNLGFSPGLPIRDVAGPPINKEPAFSPGLPLRQAYGGAPADSAPALDFDTPPPEAPPSESRIPTPLLLRREPKKGNSPF